MDTWIEVEGCYITNQPLKRVSSGAGRKRIPDPEHPPTRAFMACYHCRRLASGRIQRSRFMKTIKVSDASQLDLKIAEYILIPGTRLIGPVDNPNKFISGGQEAVEVAVA